MRRCIETLDVAGARRLHGHMAPHLPQPTSDAETLATLHHARTQTPGIALRLRVHSHHWLLDHGYPSGLPDRLRPMVERLYPRVVEAVVVSATASTELFKPVAPMIQNAMQAVAQDAYASDKPVDHVRLRADLREARVATINKLFGRVLAPLALEQSAAAAKTARAISRLTDGGSHG